MELSSLLPVALCLPSPNLLPTASSHNQLKIGPPHCPVLHHVWIIMVRLVVPPRGPTTTSGPFQEVIRRR